MSIPLRPNVLSMSPYEPGKPIETVKRELGLSRVVKLASNENPLGPSPKAVEAVKLYAEKMHLYPDGAAFQLKEAISEKYHISPSNLIIGNGSDELIHLLGLITLGAPDDELMMGDPGFSRYDAAAHLAPAKLVKVPLTADLVHDLPAMARAVTPSTRLIFIANPNNPTGTVVSKTDIKKFLEDVPASVVVVLDEAYLEFADPAWGGAAPEVANSLDFISQHPNVIGLRTFSKAYGLAGIRVGFGFTSAQIVDAINRAREPFDVNSLAQVAAIAALDDDDHVRKTVENNRRGLERLAGAFQKAGCRPYASVANFVLADLGTPAAPVFDALLRRGIITRLGTSFGLPNCLRVSVGTEEETDLFLEEFESVMNNTVKQPSVAGVAQ